MALPVSRKRILFASLLAAVGLLAAGCGDSSDTTAPTPQITEPANGTDIAPTDSAVPETSATPATSTPPIANDPESPASDPAAENSSPPTTSSPPSTTATQTAAEIPDLPPATAVAAGFEHTCALHEDGTMSCWGYSRYIQLDIAGDSSLSAVPARVSNMSEVAAIATGTGFSCALHENGSIDCFGEGFSGQLGNGDFYSSDLPVRVLDIDDATAISAGSFHVCALHADSSVSCWGSNSQGQIGNGESGGFYSDEYQADVSSPWPVLGIEDAIAVSAGSTHTCVLHSDSTVSCWGNNSYGQLGNGEKGDGWEDDSADSVVPVQVKNITDAIAIDAGAGFTCALHRNQTVSCWGFNGSGQLGTGQIGEEPSSAVPQQVEGVADAVSLSVSFAYACVIHEGGNASCWGRNWSGQLGNGIHSDDERDDTVNSAVPVPVKNLYDAIEISTGYSHACALLRNGTISCWGNNENGQIGIGGFFYVRTTAARVDVVNVADAGAVAAGGNHTCALREGGTVSCWGSNSHGQLGSGEAGAELGTAEPTSVAGIAGAAAIATSENHTCAVVENGTVFCWGNNSSGQLGNGRSGINRDDRSENTAAPATVMGIDDATGIATGWDHTCALMEDSTVSCWGNNSFGQLGDGTNRSASAPVKTADISDATAITAGWDHACALIRTGSIYCWGNNLDGNLGNGTTSSSSVPVRVADIADAAAITADGNHTCALTQSGDVYCWGSNSHDQLGDGPLGCGAIVTMGCAQRNRTDSPIPLQVTISEDATAISAGDSHTCALHEDGTASCWGNNQDGQLGDGTTDRSLRPVKAADLSDATAITAGRSHTCALRESSTITCWGNNQNEQLGDGHLPRTPQKVIGIGG